MAWLCADCITPHSTGIFWACDLTTLSRFVLMFWKILMGRRCSTPFRRCTDNPLSCRRAQPNVLRKSHCLFDTRGFSKSRTLTMSTPIEVDAFRYARIDNRSALSAPLGSTPA